MKKTTNHLVLLSVIVFIIAGAVMYFGDDSKTDGIEKREVDIVEGVKIIAFGDSLTAGYGLPASESYPAQLEVELEKRGYKVNVINSGVSGETTRGNLERASFIRNQNPDIILLGIGGNDALRLLPVEETEKNIEETIKILKGGDNPPVVILLRMQAPINVGLGYKQTFDSLYEEIADRQEVILLPFLTAEVFLNANNKLSDGIHLNKTGYKQVVDLYLADTLSEIVDKINQ